MFKNLGPRWTIIAKCLEGRTENSIKNRFYSTLRKMKCLEKNPKLRPKTKMNIGKEANSDLEISLLISQIQHFNTLLENTKNQIKKLENSYNEDWNGF